ncbi:MAG: 50S ribosomal protein L4 [Acidimicrobiaceae bacterium]|jgi:large subunit ribosomal protein L4|nr:50S ribosomal protein L4 [Acidimicrobiaceae bacterium]|tara:strand:- start:66868 stop:67524 length:657 start_codon:yes stop_codon:yes gene_type:complete
MNKVDIKKTDGAKSGSIDLDEDIFGIEPNVAVMHQVVNAQLATKRSGTHSTKTRAEVRGGGAKPWKQKGTGRARAGSSRIPHWRGGGIALGPKPRDYSQRTPKKMKRLALRSALSDRASSNSIFVVESWDFEAPNTKAAKIALESIGTEGKVLIIVDNQDLNTQKSFRNLQDVNILLSDQLNVFDILVSDSIVFTKDNLPTSNQSAATSQPVENTEEA